MELEFVNINNMEYLIIDEIKYDNSNYLYLVNNKNSNDFIIRKESGDLLVGLDNEDEFRNVMKVFAEKHNKDVVKS